MAFSADPRIGQVGMNASVQTAADFAAWLEFTNTAHVYLRRDGQLVAACRGDLPAVLARCVDAEGVWIGRQGVPA